MSGKIYLHTSKRLPDQPHPAGTIRNLRFENCRIAHLPGFARSPIDVALEDPQDLDGVSMRQLVIDGETINESTLSGQPFHSIAESTK
jgi:hypothetical protein